VLRTVVTLAAFLLATKGLFAQADETSRSWNKPVAPFRIAGNLYYVGAIEITSYLITTPEGHFLLDGGFVETAPQIEHNIAELGFKLTDVKFLLNSHAHYDHAGGLAELKKVTGAKLLASEGDAPMLRSGGHGDFRFGDTLTFPAIAPDQIVHDGEAIRLGNQMVVAHRRLAIPKAAQPGRRKSRTETRFTTSSSSAARAHSITNSSARKVTPVSRPTSKGLSHY
jgi:metallo-beta-lactamase class B